MYKNILYTSAVLYCNLLLKIYIYDNLKWDKIKY